jgi:hypothetical protein
MEYDGEQACAEEIKIGIAETFASPRGTSVGG